MDRTRIKEEISDRLAGRRLIWFGTRGDDIESAHELEEMHSVFTILASHRRRHSIHATSLEDLTGVRVDLDAYEIDEEPDTEAFARFRHLALTTLSAPSAVFTYRPSVLVSSLCFARRDRTLYLGLFKDFQNAFEHKPWVESELTDLGVPGIPWKYIADEEQMRGLRSLDDGSIMLRRSRSSGGTGLFHAHNHSELRSMWPEQNEAYVSVAPFLEGSTPLNVSAVVWHDGVTLHPLSLQLIGIEGCSTRPFGYCGNDFAAVRQLHDDIVNAVQQHTMTIGNWLRRHGYRGAFGVDFLVHDDQVLFTEINPRFQGSTHLSCEISMRMDESCLVFDHLAAHLGLDAPPTLGLRDYVDHADVSHLVAHWTGPTPASIDGTRTSESMRAADVGLTRSDVVARPSVMTDPGGTVARMTYRGSITRTGFEISQSIADVIAEVGRVEPSEGL